MMGNVERIRKYLGLKIKEKVFQGSLMKYFGKQQNVIVGLQGGLYELEGLQCEGSGQIYGQDTGLKSKMERNTVASREQIYTLVKNGRWGQRDKTKFQITVERRGGET